MGTPQFAIPSLHRLISSFDVIGVITQADRPKGRGRKMTPPPVKIAAAESNIDCIQPEKIRNPRVRDWIGEKSPDLIVVVAYGKILPPSILDFPEYGCINLHPSLLPKYRGAAPMNWALINGETETGITIMKLNPKMDAGDIILQRKAGIHPDDDYGTLSKRLSEMGSELLIDAVELIESGKAKTSVQEEREVSYAPKIRKELCQIEWSRSAREIHNLIRGLTPFPGAFTSVRGGRMKILRAEHLSGFSKSLEPGQISIGGKEGSSLYVGTGEGVLHVLTLQPAGKKAMTSAEYIRGYPVREGDTWGEDEL
jgi:methionyl-tRNA formyltransferase